MNNKKRASLILLIFTLCMAFSDNLYAQQQKELKLEQLIRVDPQPFMMQGELSHGYYVFRCKIQNLDAKPHTVTLNCSGVAKKSFELKAGESINASLPMPVTNANFGDYIRVHAENKELYTVPCHMTKKYKPLYKSYYYSTITIHGPGDDSSSNVVLICRSLHKQFTEADCIFSEADCKYWPQDRMDYSCLDCILLTPEELAAAPQGVQTALKQFVLSGGILWLLECDIQKNELDKIEWITQLRSETSPIGDSSQEPAVLQYMVGFGVVAMTDRAALDKQYTLNKPNRRRPGESEYFNAIHNADSNNQEQKTDQEVFNELYGNFEPAPLWYERENVNVWQKSFPVIKDLSIPLVGISIVIFMFVLLAGPINLFILTKYNKRILLLITVPALSFLFAGAILSYVILSDGFQTDVRLASGSYLDQRSGAYSSLIQYGVYARTASRNVVVDSDEEFNIVDLSDSKDDRLNIDWTSGKQVISSHFVPVRKPAYYKIRKAGTTRVKLDFDFNGDNPYVVNGLGKDIDHLFVRDAQGNLWKTDSVAAGQKAILTSVNRYYDKKLSNETLLRHYFTTAQWDIDEYSLNISKKGDSLYPNTYFATFSSPGPFANKEISYAREKNSYAFLLGRF